MAFPPHVFCDTSFFYACLDPKNVNHARARVLVDESASAGTAFHTTWDIVSETATLLRYRRNFQAALAFLSDVKPGLRIRDIRRPRESGGGKDFYDLWPRSSPVFL